MRRAWLCALLALCLCHGAWALAEDERRVIWLDWEAAEMDSQAEALAAALEACSASMVVYYAYPRLLDDESIAAERAWLQAVVASVPNAGWLEVAMPDPTGDVAEDVLMHAFLWDDTVVQIMRGGGRPVAFYMAEPALQPSLLEVVQTVEGAYAVLPQPLMDTETDTR